MKDDKFIRYLQVRFQQTGNINDIARDEVVEFEGENLKIGEFLGAIRRQHRLYVKGKTDRGCKSPLTLSRYDILEQMQFVWEPGTVKQQELQENDPCLTFVTNYYDEHNTFVGIPETVIIENKEHNIRAFLSHVRTNHKKYLTGNNQKGSNSPTALRRYAALDARGFDWEPKLRKQRVQEEDDKFIRFLENYYAEHGSLDEVPKIVIFEDTELNIDNFLSDRRKKHRKKQLNPEYKPSKLEQQRWAALDKMHYDWDFHNKRKRELLENDPYIRYLNWHFKEYGTINDITPRQEVEFEGKTLRIGVFINDYRKKHYAYTTKKIKASSVTSPLAMKRYADLESLQIDWRPSETTFSTEKHAREHNIQPKKLRKYIEKFGGNIDKATKICQAARSHSIKQQSSSKKSATTLETLAKEFEINIHTLITLLTKKSLKQRASATEILMYDEKTNLRDFCINNGLNYTVIQKAIKLKRQELCNEDLESLINRVVCEYNKKGQKHPSTWIYSKYGNEVLVRHLLLSMQLDPTAILRDMSKNCITIEKAIENNIFKRNSTQEQTYLAPLYHDLIGFFNKVNHSTDYTPETATIAILDYFKQMTINYSLTEEEFNVIRKSFVQYSNSIETYRLYNVGFEKNPQKRVEKIIQYQFDEEEIEEAFFMPLRFDQKVLIGRDSELYKRNTLIKNLTISWNELTAAEQEEKICSYGLTTEELHYITSTRQSIDETKGKVFSKK